MGTTLQHGIFLPAEGERNCYAGLASNWTILDGVVGGYSSHAANLTIHVTAADKEAWNGKADASALTAHTGNTTIHVTAADKEAWNGKADASALTAHTGNTTIHVTAADKNKWDAVTSKADASALTAHTGNTTIHVTAEDKTKWDAVTSKADASALTAHTGNTTIHVTAEDKTKWDAVTSKADDSGVMHLSGNETASGIKTFNNVVPINGAYLGNEPSATFRSVLLLRSRFDTAEKSGWLVSKFRSNAAQGALGNSGSVFLSFDVLENEVRTNGILRFYLSNWSGDAPGKFLLLPDSAIESFLGSSANKWKAINGINPGALSLPNLSAGVDISAYITDLTGASNINKFTPTADGWISIGLSNADFIEIYIPSNLMGASFAKNTLNNSGLAFMPVIANKEVKITLKGSSIGWAKFYPCQGNV